MCQNFKKLGQLILNTLEDKYTTKVITKTQLKKKKVI